MYFIGRLHETKIVAWAIQKKIYLFSVHKKRELSDHILEVISIWKWTKLEMPQNVFFRARSLHGIAN
jgi:hypothetical protein